MIGISPPALSRDYFVHRVPLKQEFLSLLSRTRPLHQRLKRVLEKMFLKEPHTISITCGPRLNSNTNSLLKLVGVRCLLYFSIDSLSQGRNSIYNHVRENTEALNGWWTELLGKGGQNMLGHGEDHLVVVAQKHQKDCAGLMRKVARLGEPV